MSGKIYAVVRGEYDVVSVRIRLGGDEVAADEFVDCGTEDLVDGTFAGRGDLDFVVDAVEERGVDRLMQVAGAKNDHVGLVADAVQGCEQLVRCPDAVVAFAAFGELFAGPGDAFYLVDEYAHEFSLVLC